MSLYRTVSTCTFCCERECDDGLCLCEVCEPIITDAIWKRTRDDLNGFVSDCADKLDENEAYVWERTRDDLEALVTDYLWALDSDDWTEPWLAEVRP